jgi:hypothetical protein
MSVGPDVGIFQNIDWDMSKWDSVVYNEDLNFAGLQAKEKFGVVFEIKLYDPHEEIRRKGCEHVGWAYLPLFNQLSNEDGVTHGLFTNAGRISVPVWRGAVNRKLLLTAFNSDSPYLTLSKE